MTPLILSVASIILLFVVNFLLSHRKRIALLQEKNALLEKQMDQIVKDHPLLINADLYFSKQLREINAQLVSMDNQIQELENKRDNDGGYQHALRILEMGGNKEEIVENCHLSSAEAELLMNLHAYRAAIKA